MKTRLLYIGIMIVLLLGFVVNVVIGQEPVMSGGVQIFGFDDFCYDEICYDNPSGRLAIALGGRSLVVTDRAINSAYVSGPSVGIGLDPTTNLAYINGSAFGLHSLSGTGPDAGDYMCGRLYAKLLRQNPCSLFVHVPQSLGYYDLFIVLGAIARVEVCSQNSEYP